VTSEDSRFSFHSLAPEQTRSAAFSLARVLPGEGIVLSLSGGLGVGKTQFVKGLAEGLGLDPASVTSPTFAIVNEYGAGAGPGLIHMDFYRLESEMALEEVGFLDLLAAGVILAIEWGDRFPNALPEDRMEIQLERPAVAIASTEQNGLEGAVAEISNENEVQHPPNAVERSPREFRISALGPVSQTTLRKWRDAQPWEGAIESAK
jgi:tRNA threonylcarbamoyladenosine biosynthesis protein TsaE